jgi:hypothetical protein
MAMRYHHLVALYKLYVKSINHVTRLNNVLIYDEDPCLQSAKGGSLLGLGIVLSFWRHTCRNIRIRRYIN